MFDPECTVCCIAGSAKCAVHSKRMSPEDMQMSIDMSEAKADDYWRLVQKLRAGLQEIYRMRGEDELIANICSPLIDESAP